MWDPSLSVVSQLEPVATSAEFDKTNEETLTSESWDIYIYYIYDYI